MNPVYYLETNALYALCNYFSEIDKVDTDVSTSLFALKEVVDGIDEKTFWKRKVLLDKVVDGKVKIYPYLPMECIALGFKLDISEMPWILEQKKQLCDEINLIRTSDDFSAYCIEHEKMTGTDVRETKRVGDENEQKNKKTISNLIDDDRRKIKQLKKEQDENPEYIEVNIDELLVQEDDTDWGEKEKQDLEFMLTNLLSSLDIEYSEDDISEVIMNRDKNALIAFELGNQLYGASKGLELDKKSAGRNDLNDLIHLLYLRNRNHIIVSDDNIFSFCTMAEMRMKTDDFLKLIKKN